MHSTAILQQDLFDYMPDGIVVLDQRGVVVSCNRAAPHLFGLPFCEWVGQPLRAAIAASPLAGDVYALLGRVPAVATRTSVYTGEAGLVGVEIRLHPLPGDGVRAGMVLVLRDITERLRAEDALSQRMAELMLLNHVARVANAALDTESVLRAISATPIRALQWDRIAVALVQSDGVTLRMFVDQSLHGTSTDVRTGVEDDHALMLNLLQSHRARVLYVNEVPSEMLADTTTRRMAFQVAGTPTAASLARAGLEMMLAVPLYSGTKALGMLFVTSGTARPIPADELRLFETISTLVSDAMARTTLYDEARQANQLKTVFLASVTHELRSPMTSIIGFADMLARGAFGDLPEMADEPVDLIRHSSKRLLRVINDILDYSKMESGRLKMDLYAVDIASVVRTVASTMQPQLHERHLSLNIDLPPAAPQIYANSSRLEQVLINLVANAIKFTERGGITVRVIQRGDELCISVQDTGIGIAPEDQEKIFEPFKQVEHKNQRYGGTGLGLAISKRLMELMGGTLTLESTVGVGSTFMCVLPVVVPMSNDSEPASVLVRIPAQPLRDTFALAVDLQ